MMFFIDTSNVDKVPKAADMGVIYGVSTNPSPIAKERRAFVTLPCFAIEQMTKHPLTRTNIKKIKQDYLAVFGG